MRSKGILIRATSVALFFTTHLFAAEVAITIDDFDLREGPMLNRIQRDEGVLRALKKHQVEAAVFISCQYMANPEIKARVSHWDRAKHLIANHTYSHWFYDEKGFEAFSKDVKRCHEMLKDYSSFSPLFRFPYLKGGKTAEQRDMIQRYLKDLDYKNGYVTIDASDWYVSSQMEKAIKANPKTDLKPYRDYYLKHMWDRSVYYDELGKKHWKKPLKHTVLIHHNLLNALFLSDLIQMYKDKGWKIIPASEAFKDPLFDEVPDVLPHGESILWMLAKKAGDKTLRYPGEDSQFEKKEMAKLGL